MERKVEVPLGTGGSNGADIFWGDTTFPHGCETYGLFAVVYQDGGTLCHHAPTGLFTSHDFCTGHDLYLLTVNC